MKRFPILPVTSVLSFTGFFLLSRWAGKHPHPSLDIDTTHQLQRIQSSRLKAFVLIGNTTTSSAVMLNILALPVAFAFWKRRLREEALLTVSLSWLSALMRTLIKKIVHRPRPEHGLVEVTSRSKGSSFPSGHVSSAMTFWGWLLLWAWRQRKEATPVQWSTISLAALCLLLSGPSRIYLGEHWFTDVLGGYLFGYGWLSMGFQLYLYLRKDDTVAKL